MAAELLKEFEPEIETVTLIPSEGGRYEIEVNGKLLYSKINSGRHAEPREVAKLVRDYLKDPKR